jgi:hypothetical protein
MTADVRSAAREVRGGRDRARSAERTTMMKLETNRLVRAPLQRVFAAATDLHGAPARIPTILKLEVLTDGPIRAGTRFRETRRLFGREATAEMEILALEPLRSYLVGCDDHGCSYRTEFRFEPRDGGTHVTMEFTAEPMTTSAKIMSFLMRPLMRKALNECMKDLDELAKSIESGK